MAETKTQPVKTLEREYTIPLRRVWLNVPEYNRTKKAVKAIKIFLAKHFKVPDRDLKYIKLDVAFNNDLWFRGRSKPPSKVKVKAIKEGDIVKVTFVEVPKHVAFESAKHVRRHKQAEEKKAPTTPEAPKQEKTDEEKKEEKEKGKSVADQALKDNKVTAKAEKKATPVKTPNIQRKALKK